ncbi:hypothetical protein CEXT_642231 [Caerostris extrusa]|uniref:Uncharacterized protein n=1 Tax=Caerostris extrusa TaxID=172846 RepID=A0AAV4WCH2_CAEEX|nr:hypothetical protein CEXT_642231 [Caerostris extrusa]
MMTADEKNQKRRPSFLPLWSAGTHFGRTLGLVTQMSFLGSVRRSRTWSRRSFLSDSFWMLHRTFEPAQNTSTSEGETNIIEMQNTLLKCYLRGDI